VLDLLVRGGLVFDGEGRPPFRADVAVRDGRVVGLAPALTAAAAETVDASGLWVTPGFVDIHTHYDVEVEVAPALEESVRHGVTTIVMGNCSLSLTVGEPETLADIFLRVETLPRVLVERWLRQAVLWRSPAEYVEHLGRLPLGPNVAALLGHSALRAEVMGLGRSLTERATDADLDAMRALAVEALEAGCLGISADMVPWHMMAGAWKGRTIPSQHADLREYAMLTEVCRARDAVFQVTPNPHDPRSFWRLLRLAAGEPPLRLTVLAALDSVAQRRLWRLFGPLLAVLNDGLGWNARFQTLAEPFTVYSDGPLTPLFEEFPAGVRLNDAESAEERRALWASPAFRFGFDREWRSRARRSFHRDLALVEIVACPDRALEGRTVAEVARARGQDPVHAFVDLLAEHDTALRWVATGANDRPGPRQALMRHRHILPGFTDAGAHARNLGYYDSALSLLRQAVTTGFLTPARAVQRVTGEPAAWFRLDAGVLREGAPADLVLLRPSGLATPIAPQVALADPVLEGAPRMVKRGSDEAIAGVWIGGRRAHGNGRREPVLGRERLGRVLTLPAGGPPPEPISEEIREHPFTDYWDVFVLKHQRPANVACHAAGVVLFYGLLALPLLGASWWWLALLPLSQAIGLAGHRLFEPSHVDRRDAIFSLRASRCLNRMFLRLLTGRYAGDVRRLRTELAAYRAARAAAPTGGGAPVSPVGRPEPATA
jgi:N-acyl-D-aspartate/D-glutamate deacylase